MENLTLIEEGQYRNIIEKKEENCLVVFSKETCSVCKKLEPVITKIAGEYEGNDELNFYTMDVKNDGSKKVFKELNLVGVPQTVFIKEGEVKETLPGALSEPILRSEIDDLLNPKQGLGAKLKGFFGLNK